MLEITISKDRFNDMIEEICDFYCKWPINCEDQAQLNRMCEDCPLNNLTYDPFWERRENNGN